MDRRELLLSMFDASGFGLEVGPSYSPLLPKRLGYNVETVDHADAEELRQKYKSDGNVDAGNIEEVDYVSDGGSLVDLIGQTERYDYIFASHVIEHVTDVVRFLSDCERLLKPDGVLVLAVPDKRFCFDVLRPVSTVGSAIQTYLENPKRHAPGMVFDHVSLVSRKNGNIVWLEPNLDGIDFIHSIGEAKAALEQAQTQPDYIDIHRWQFTPEYFRYFVHVLAETGFIGLRESRFHKNDAIHLHLHEFYITLSRAGSGPDAPMLDLLKAAHRELREIAVAGHGSMQVPRNAGQTDVETILDALRETQWQLKAERAGAAAREDELAALRNELAMAQAHKDAVLNSSSWRITAPLRRLKDVISR